MGEIFLSEDFSTLYSDIRSKAKQGEGDSVYLKSIIENGLEKLKGNHQAGQKIQKRLWPDYYVQRYGINNLWRLRLDGFWRMLYTIKGTRVSIMAIVLEVIGHKDYDKKFGYK